MHTQRLAGAALTVVSLAVLSGCSTPTVEEQARTIAEELYKRTLVEHRSADDLYCIPPSTPYDSADYEGDTPDKIEARSAEGPVEGVYQVWVDRTYKNGQDSSTRVDIDVVDGEVCIK